MIAEQGHRSTIILLSHTFNLAWFPTWWARQIRSRSWRLRNLLTTSAPKVNDTPRSFSPQPWTSLSGSDHSRSHSRPADNKHMVDFSPVLSYVWKTVTTLHSLPVENSSRIKILLRLENGQCSPQTHQEALCPVSNTPGWSLCPAAGHNDHQGAWWGHDGSTLPYNNVGPPQFLGIGPLFWTVCVIKYILLVYHNGMWWCRGMFCALQLKGRRFEST